MRITRGTDCLLQLLWSSVDVLQPQLLAERLLGWCGMGGHVPANSDYAPQHQDGMDLAVSHNQQRRGAGMRKAEACQDLDYQLSLGACT